MGIFDNIRIALWGADEAAATRNTANDGDDGAVAVAPEVPTSANNAAMRDVAAAGVQPVSKPAAIEQAQNPAALPTEVDVAEQLDRAAKSRGSTLDWRHSIVDLMKSLGMDASLKERKELAKELNYEGDPDDSAKMNTYLHKALIERLAQNGGRFRPILRIEHD